MTRRRSRTANHAAVPLLLLLGITLSAPLPAAARQVRGEPGAVRPAPRDASVGGTLVGAVLGGAAGLVAGALAGGSGDCYEICEDLVVGALVGEAFGVAIGAVAGNGGRGNFPATFLAAGAGTGLGLLLARKTEGSGVLAAAAVQVAAVTIVQVRTSPRIGVAPTLDPSNRAAGVALRVRW